VVHAPWTYPFSKSFLVLEFLRSLAAAFRWTLCCAAIIACSGCYEEIAYEPAAEESQQPPTPEADPTPRDDVPNASPEEPAEITAVPPATEPANDEPTSSEPPPAGESSPPEFDVDDLFGDAAAEPEPVNPGPSVEAPSDTQGQPAVREEEASLLPWENEGDRYRQADQTRVPEGEDTASQASTTESPTATTTTEETEPLLPWETPAEQGVATAQPTTAESEADVPPPDVVEHEEQQLPEVSPSSAEVDSPDERLASASPVVQPGPTTSRHAAWLLGSKLSFTLLAPAEEAVRVKPELAPLASLLGVELPATNIEIDPDDPEGLARVLAIGRDVGEQLSARHGASHAALIEIAFKSNVLLAAYDEMPHLAHSIGGSVSAASVRAGLPESIWQPWQDNIVAGESVEAVQGAVLELHTQVDEYLRDPPAEVGQAILR
jgi:hypothetical protein